MYEVFVCRRFKAFIYARSQGCETYMEQPFEHVIYFAPATKIYVQILCRKNLFLLTIRYDLMIIFMGIYQIGSLSLNVSFVLTIMNILRTRFDIYICAHGT